VEKEDDMKNLKALVEAGKVTLKATVYVNARNGFDFFMREMENFGLTNLVEGVHYFLNKADASPFLKPYTGEVYIEGPVSRELIEEIADMLAERNSTPTYSKSGTMRVYNNPLFREAVSLGAWSRPAKPCAWTADEGASLPWVTEAIETAKVARRKAKIEAAANSLSELNMVEIPKVKTTTIRGVECCGCGINVKYCPKCNPERQAVLAAEKRDKSKLATKLKATIKRNETAIGQHEAKIAEARAS
jgi:hypothetical protein